MTRKLPSEIMNPTNRLPAPNQTTTTPYPNSTMADILMRHLERYIEGLGEPGLSQERAWKLGNARATLAVLRAELEELESSVT
jgi:hypothetical protein